MWQGYNYITMCYSNQLQQKVGCCDVELGEIDPTFEVGVGIGSVGKKWNIVASRLDKSHIW